MFLPAGFAVTPYDSILYRNLIFDTGGIVTAVDTMCYIIEVHNIKLERDTLSKM